MRVKASDPSHPIIHTQCQAPSPLSSLFSLMPAKLLSIHHPPTPSPLSCLFSEFVNIFQGCWSTHPHFKRGNLQQPLPRSKPSHCLPTYTRTHKADLHDTFCAGGSIWIIQYGEFKVSVFIKKAAGVRERNILDELVSSNPCLSLG